MASLLRAIGSWFRKQRDEAADVITDKVAEGKFAIEDAKKEARQFEKKIAELMAANKLAMRHRDNAQEEVDKFLGIAKMAADQGNEEDARKALKEKKNAEASYNTSDQEVQRNEKLVTQLRDRLEKVRSKIARAESNQAQLAARMEGAKVRKALVSAAGDFGGGGALSRLDDLQEAVDKAECEAEAYEELTVDNTDLEEKYSTADSSVDDELAALMGKNQASA